MIYKDLIYKLTSKNSNNFEHNPNKYENEFNNNELKFIKPKKAKIKHIDKKFSVGVMIKDSDKITEEWIKPLKNMIDRILTIHSQVPVLKDYKLVTKDKESLDFCVRNFQDIPNIFIADKNNVDFLNVLDQLTKQFLNFKTYIPSKNPKRDFANSIDILITVNIDKLDEDLNSFLLNNNINIYKLDFRKDGENKSQKERLVKATSTGWNYNPATGKWVKSLPDGTDEIEGW